MSLITALVLTVKVADAPEGEIVTDEGRTTAPDAVDSLTTVPTEGTAFRVTEPVTELPPATEEGETVTLLTWSGLTTTVTVLLTPR